MATKCSTRKRKKRERRHKDLLPYDDFPLSPHVPTGQWYKTIRGHRHYFGKLDDWEAAEAKYQQVKDGLYAGRTPRLNAGGLELRDLVNHFLTAKQRKVDAGELRLATFGAYYAIAAKVIDAFGAKHLVADISADDFGRLRSGLAETLGPAELGKQVQVVRMLFKFGYESGLIDKPQRFGPEFVRPAKKILRKARRAKPAQMFSPDQIRAMLGKASPQMTGMVLLGINCGFGNTDCAELPQDAIDFGAGIIDWPRPKTEISRRCVLWPETVKALREAIKHRPKPIAAADRGLVFLTMYGRRWVRFQRTDPNKRGVWIDSIGLQFGKQLRALKVKRKGISFYTLRHTHRTVADEISDRPSLDLIMGHEAANDMATHYREQISDDRLRRVTDHVHQWLFGG